MPAYMEHEKTTYAPFHMIYEECYHEDELMNIL